MARSVWPSWLICVRKKKSDEINGEINDAKNSAGNRIAFIFSLGRLQFGALNQWHDRRINWISFYLWCDFWVLDFSLHYVRVFWWWQLLSNRWHEWIKVIHWLNTQLYRWVPTQYTRSTQIFSCAIKIKWRERPRHFCVAHRTSNTSMASISTETPFFSKTHSFVESHVDRIVNAPNGKVILTKLVFVFR